MFESRKIFNERKAEIEGFFDHLSSFEKQNSNRELEQTLKASCFLLLYNLVESTLTQAIIAIYDDLEEKKVEYCSIKEILKKRVVKNLVGKQDIDRLHDRFLQSGGNILVSGFNAVALFSGNVDARRVREIAQEYGFSDRINKKVKGAADDLLTIKTNRNDLAHGSKSFSEIGRDYTIEQLKEIKDSSLAYLDCILKNIENYIQEQEYLI